MTLIKSISGIRGTIGGKVGDSLTPYDVVKFTAAYATWLQGQHPPKTKCKIVLGRDARISGPMIHQLVCGTLTAKGMDVIDVGLSTTPTVEMAVTFHKAHGGIILTASHNPKQWNALKLLNGKGEFISAADGEQLLKIAENDNMEFAQINQIGTVTKDDTAIQKHIEAILALPLVNRKAISEKKFKVVIDCVNSSGGIALPPLLKALGVEEVTELYCTPDGNFPHNPEPLPEHLTDLSKTVVKNKAHLGISVDPDVDRLALVCEDGEMFGEEYTLVAVADYVLKHNKGNTVSNLSSTRALRDVTEKAGGTYYASAVGEVNVVEMMKAKQAVIGGEGNGGVIYPELHYGRDALAGIALFLSHLALYGKSVSMLRASYPDYFISKNKIELTPEISVDGVLESMKEKYKKHKINSIDGVKIEFEKEWVHLRKSNTEPIIRIYAESESLTTAENLAEKIILDIKEVINHPAQA
ncbi:MAG TPA: phosphoglucosamine mutase [Bacteroidia bacterium]|nr:MAG: phosphoglucosamine mutase [Bacteroidetes bacterium OLB10]MBX3105600.1 phosphoglucosamine mutase [Bacteroidota bacterium]MCB8931165.1 phosphoglucosamine mutase [Bacteroidia bacterium]MCB0849659.1 phosphoglucosamine mutase [Bacteroidota bacterium]MCW5930381.1 phosphoglucosamine mutase [Bacteroidota bacterium]